MPATLTLLGLTKEQWDLSGPLATWLSSLASFLAVAAALWLANRQNRHTAKLTIRSVLIFTTGEGAPDPKRYVQFNVVNTGQRPIRIAQLGWQSGVFNKQNVMQMIPPDLGPRLPVDLAHGENATWHVPADYRPTQPWEDLIAEKLLKSSGIAPVLSMRGFVTTTVGRTFKARPDSVIRGRLREALTRVDE